MDRPASDGGVGLLVAAYVALFLLGAATGVWGAFLVPLRLFGHLEGLADVVGVAGPLVAGYYGAMGVRTAAAAVMPGIGWIVAVLVLGYSRGGDVVIPAGLSNDPGVGVVGKAYLVCGLVGLLGAGVLAARRLRPRGAA